MKQCKVCGRLNPIENETCDDCGAVFPRPWVVLNHVGEPQKRVVIKDNETRVGTEQQFENDFFKNQKENGVSRNHCSFSFINGYWYVTDGCQTDSGWKSSENGTYVDRKNKKNSLTRTRCVADFPERLNSGDVLSISACKFIVELVPADDANQIDPADEILFVVTCPKCFHKYLVSGEESRVNECQECWPEDKTAIRNVKSVPMSLQSVDLTSCIDLRGEHNTHVD